MASRQHHTRRGIASGAYREDVACAVDFRSRACVAQPSDDEVAPLPVEIGKGKTPNASLGRRADLGQLHQRSPKASAIDSKRARGITLIGRSRHRQPSSFARSLAATEL